MGSDHSLYHRGLWNKRILCSKSRPENNWIRAETIKNYRKPLKKVSYGCSHAGGHWFESSSLHHKNNHTKWCGYFYGIRGNLKCSTEVNSASAKVSPAAKRLYGATRRPAVRGPDQRLHLFRQHKTKKFLSVPFPVWATAWVSGKRPQK